MVSMWFTRFAISIASILMHETHALMVQDSAFLGTLSGYCNISSRSGVGVEADCQTGNISLGELLPMLHKDTTSLTFCVGRLDSSYIEDNVSFSNLPKLIDLKLIWKKGFIFYEPYRFKNSNLFHGLIKLRSIHIGIPTYTLPMSILAPLDKLNVLDLSGTAYMNTLTLAELFKKSHLEKKPLQALKLRRIAGIQGDQYGYFRLSELLPLLEKYNITYLDISENGDLYLYPGLIKYASHLEHIIMKDNGIRFTSGNAKEATCFIIDGYLHQKLRHIDIRGLNFVGPTDVFFPTDFLHMVMSCSWVNKGDCVCKSYNEYCGQYNIVSNCKLFPNYNLADLIDYDCYMKAKIPLPKSVEEFLTGNNKFAFPAGDNTDFERRNVCFGPNKIRIFDASHVNFPIGSTGGNMTISGWENMTEMNLSYSGWGSFFHNPKFLHTMTGLQSIDLSGTNIGIYIRNDTVSDIFKKSKKLRVLFLQDAGLTHVPEQEFSACQHLEKLDVSKNKLSMVSFNLKNLISLRYLDLSDNQLSTFRPNTMYALDLIAEGEHTVEVNLLGNVLSCGCDDLHFLRWIHQTKVQLVGCDQYICIDHNSEEISLKSVDLKALTLKCYQYYIVSAVLVICLAAFVVIGAIVYRYRKRLYYFYLWIKYRRELTDSKNEQIFCIYSDDDRLWVHNTLLKKVEKEMGHRLIIHHRDFIPGHVITDQIARCIRTSRKTIAVLSESFLDSEWCPYELLEARRLLATEGRDVIIPIILSELPPKKIGSTLRTILKEKNYIKWNESFDGEKHFWKRINLAIRRSKQERVGSQEECRQQQEPGITSNAQENNRV